MQRALRCWPGYRHRKGRRGSLLWRRGEVKATIQGFHAFPDSQEADLRRANTSRVDSLRPCARRKIEAAFVTHHDLKKALVASQTDRRLFYGRMLCGVDQQSPHRAKEQHGTTGRKTELSHSINFYSYL